MKAWVLAAVAAVKAFWGRVKVAGKAIKAIFTAAAVLALLVGLPLACSDKSIPTAPVVKLAPAEGTGVGTPCSAEGRVWGLGSGDGVWAFSCQNGVVVEYRLADGCPNAPAWAQPYACAGLPPCPAGAPPVNCNPNVPPSPTPTLPPCPPGAPPVGCK